jgi:hypothetical protein
MFALIELSAAVLYTTNQRHTPIHGAYGERHMLHSLAMHTPRSREGNGRAHRRAKASASPPCQQGAVCILHTVIRLPHASQR